MMEHAPRPFFQSGGTMPLDADSYVLRAADHELVQALAAGDYCFLLNSRQIGKSSLCVRAMEELRARGFRVAFLDLTKFGGRNLTAEQWYVGMLREVGRAIGVDEPMLDYWRHETDLGPMQRFFGALREVALTSNPAEASPLIILIDEIDATRSLPFDTDEFFAGIRECFNRRVQDPVYEDLTFCLIGVATPSDLIRDPMTTPFNIGRRIELRDFTEEEAMPLAVGLGVNGAQKMKRILYWTGGHPFLTQAVCAEAAQHADEGIDRIVEQMFFHAKARETNVNLADVQNRLLGVVPEGVSPEEHRAAILDLYQQVRDRKRSVRDDESDGLSALLKLSGLARVLDGYLWIRNRIYFRVFDRDWIRAQMPGAELERQNRAARRAALRVATVAGLVTAAVGASALFGYAKAREADAATKRALLFAQSERERSREAADANQAAQRALSMAQAETRRANLKAEEAKQAKEQTRAALAEVSMEKDRAVEAGLVANRERKAALLAKHLADGAAKMEKEAANAERLALENSNRLLYQAKMGLIQSAFAANQFDRVQELLDESAQPRYAAMRGIEWDYWHLQMNGPVVSWPGNDEGHTQCDFSPDGRQLLKCSNGMVRLLDIATQKVLFKKEGNYGDFSPDGKHLLIGLKHKIVEIWDWKTKAVSRQLASKPQGYNYAFFSKDGNRLIAGDFENIYVIDARNGREQIVLPAGDIWSKSLSGDENRLVSTGPNTSPRVWDVKTGRVISSFKVDNGPFWFSLFAPGRDSIVTTSQNGDAWVWDPATGLITAKFTAPATRSIGGFSGFALSPDGSRIAFGCRDKVVRIWDISTGKESAVLDGHTESATLIAFSPDGSRIATACGDDTMDPNSILNARDYSVRVWDAWTGEELSRYSGHTSLITSLSFSPDGTQLVSASLGGAVKLWDVTSESPYITFPGINAKLSRDGFLLLTENGGKVSAWNTKTNQKRTEFHGVIAKFSSNYKWIVGSDGKILYVLDASTLLRVQSLNGLPADPMIFDLDISPDGSRIVADIGSGGRDIKTYLWKIRRTYLWNALGGRMIATFEGTDPALSYDGNEVAVNLGHAVGIFSARDGKPSGRIDIGRLLYDMALSHDDRRVAIVTESEPAAVWDRQSAKQIALLDDAEDMIEFFPDSERLLTTRQDGTAVIWRAKDGTEIALLKGHPSVVAGACISPDGNRVVTSGADKTIRFWDTNTGQQLLSIPGLGGNISLAADGKMLVTSDGQVTRLYPLSKGIAKKLTLSRQEAWKTIQLSRSAERGDLFAWHWQFKHWFGKIDVKNSDLSMALTQAVKSPNSTIAEEARKLLANNAQ